MVQYLQSYLEDVPKISKKEALTFDRDIKTMKDRRQISCDMQMIADYCGSL